MNSMELIQSVVTRWMTVDDQTELSVRQSEGLLSALNRAVADVWRKLPVSMKLQTDSWEFEGPSTGTVNLTSGSKAATSWTPALGDREFCSLQLAGSPLPNEYRGGGLLHSWRGPTGEASFLLHHDALILPNRIERVVSPLEDIECRNRWQFCPLYDFYQAQFSMERFYTIHHPVIAGVSRTVVQLSVADRPLTFRPLLLVTPSSLTLEHGLEAIDLPYADDVAEIVESFIGMNLLTHPMFRSTPQAASAARTEALDQLAMLPRSETSEFNTIGTPFGY